MKKLSLYEEGQTFLCSLKTHSLQENTVLFCRPSEEGQIFNLSQANDYFISKGSYARLPNFLLEQNLFEPYTTI